jgi:hypothetical protein
MTWLHRGFRPIKSLLPARVSQPLRAVVTAVATPIQFSWKTGHFKSSLRAHAVDSRGSPLPWYTYPSIDFLSRRSFAGRHVAEIGAGQSTLWWADRADSVTAFEEDAEWLASVRRRAPGNVQISFAPVAKGIQPIVSALGQRKYDIIAIDGHWRRELIDAALAHLTTDGALIFDNADTYGFAEEIRGRPFLRADFFGYAPGVILPHCTSIVFTPHCFLFSADASMLPVQRGGIPAGDSTH